MPEIIANRLHGQTVIEQMLRGGVSQRMRTATLAGDAEAIEAASDDVPYRAPAQWPDRSAQREKQRPLRARETNLADIAQNCVSDAAGER